MQSYTSARSLLNKLQHVLAEDSHNGADGYLVRSLYFDTLYDDDFYDKDDGLENRQKIRLRIYPPNFDLVKLELKEKRGANQRKRSLRMSREDAIRLINRDYSVLLGYNDELAQELFITMSLSQYIPRTIIEYNRAAFILPVNDIRITFDSNIRAKEAGFTDFFAEKPSLYPVMHPDNSILEVKYNHFLFEYVRQVINFNGKLETSASKYFLARGIGHC